MQGVIDTYETLGNLSGHDDGTAGHCGRRGAFDFCSAEMTGIFMAVCGRMDHSDDRASGDRVSGEEDKTS